jgi:urease accessory protein
VRARAELAVGDRLRVVEDPPLAFRFTPLGLYQVGTAGGPTGDDDLELDIRIGAGRALRLGAVAATVVYSGTGTRQAATVQLGAGARLDWQPPPVIATAGCRHRQETRVLLGAGAHLDITEVLVLGRHGEGPGAVTQRLTVDADGRPLLRHELSAGPGAAGWDGPAVLGDDRAVGLRLVAGAGLGPPPVTTGEGWAWCRLDGPGWLLVATAPDHATLRRRLAAAAADGAPVPVAARSAAVVGSPPPPG